MKGNWYRLLAQGRRCIAFDGGFGSPREMGGVLPPSLVPCSILIPRQIEAGSRHDRVVRGPAERRESSCEEQRERRAPAFLRTVDERDPRFDRRPQRPRE